MQGTLANPTNNLFLVSDSIIFIDMKPKVLPHFAFTRSVFSLTEEVEDSTGTVGSIAISPRGLAACACAHALAWVRAAYRVRGGVYLSIPSIYLLHITVRSFLLIYRIIDINYCLLFGVKCKIGT